MPVPPKARETQEHRPFEAPLAARGKPGKQECLCHQRQEKPKTHPSHKLRRMGHPAEALYVEAARYRVVARSEVQSEVKPEIGALLIRRTQCHHVRYF